LGLINNKREKNMLDLYYVIHVGAFYTEKYLHKNGDFGAWKGALSFPSLDEAHEASSKTDLNTAVVDDGGNLHWS
jgi:hypothetical protein